MAKQVAKGAVNNVAKQVVKGAVNNVAKQMSPHFQNAADSIFNSPGMKKGYSSANNIMSEYSQGNLASSLAAQYGFTEEGINHKAIAATNLIAKLMQDPEVQKAVANVDVAAVGMGANLVNKLEPIVLKTTLKAGNELSTAGIQSVQGIVDAIPGIDDVEGLMQLIYAGTKMAAAGMTTATSAVEAGTDVVNTVGEEGAELASKVDTTISALANAIPSPPKVQQPNAVKGSPKAQQQPKTLPKTVKKGGTRRRNKSHRRNKSRRLSRYR